MAKIVAIEPHEKGALLVLEPYGEIVCTLELKALEPLVGVELDDEGEAELLRTLTAPALNAGAAQLAMRPLSRKLLIEKLVEKGHDPFLSELAADKLADYGALDDAEYARIFAADRSARGWGEVRIRSELKFRGVEQELIDEALDELDEPSDAIEEFIRSKARGELLDRKAAKKVSDALMRKGFRWDEIRPILSQYTED